MPHITQTVKVKKWDKTIFNDQIASEEKTTDKVFKVSYWIGSNQGFCCAQTHKWVSSHSFACKILSVSQDFYVEVWKLAKPLSWIL